MAHVTFTTSLGTDIRVSNLQSNSSFEILKAAVALIEGIEIAEQTGQAEKVLKEGMSAEVGSSGGLILTSRPEDVVFLDQTEELEQAAPCNNPYCPIHGEVELDEQTLGEIVAESLGLTIDELDEDVDYAEILEVINKTYADTEEMILEFVERLPGNLQEALPEIEAFASELCDYADHLDEENPARATIFGIGSGIKLGAVWAGLSEGLPPTQFLSLVA